MQWSGWRQWAAIGLLLSSFLGCAPPSASQTPPLTTAAATHTLDSWNPGFCKVADFYGFYLSGQNSAKPGGLSCSSATPAIRRKNPWST